MSKTFSVTIPRLTFKYVETSRPWQFWKVVYSFLSKVILWGQHDSTGGRALPLNGVSHLASHLFSWTQEVVPVYIWVSQNVILLLLPSEKVHVLCWTCVCGGNRARWVGGGGSFSNFLNYLSSNKIIFASLKNKWMLNF